MFFAFDAVYTSSMNAIQQRLFDALCSFDSLCSTNGIQYYLAYGTLLGAIRHEGFIPWDDDVDVFMKRADYERFLALDASLKGTDFSIDAWETDKGHHWPFAKFRNTSTSLHLRDDDRFGTRGRGVWIDVFPLDPCPSQQDKSFQRWFKKRKRLCSFIAVKSLKWKNTWTARQRIGKLLAMFVSRERFIRQFKALNKRFGDGEDFLLSAEYDDRIFMYPSSVFSQQKLVKFEGVLFPIPQQYQELLTIMYGDYMTPPPLSERHTHFAAIEK